MLIEGVFEVSIICKIQPLQQPKYPFSPETRINTAKSGFSKSFGHSATFFCRSAKFLLFSEISAVA